MLRLAGLVSPGHFGDMTAFVHWAEGAAEHGLGGYYAAGGDSNYPPMLYLLYPLGVALDGVELAFAIRLLSIPFDLALGVLLYLVVAEATGREGDGLIAAAFYLLNPAVLMSGPIWGQVDGMGALPMVAAIVAAARGRVVWAGGARRHRRPRQAPVRDRRVRPRRPRPVLAPLAGRHPACGPRSRCRRW